MSVDIPAPPAEFAQALRDAGIELDSGDEARLTRYLHLLYAANEHMNLTAVRDPAAAWMRHIFDGLTPLPILTQADAKRVADIGSGGGIPGLVLACVLPEVEFALIESVGKKARFLEETARALGLSKVRVSNARAEALGRGELRDRMDVVVSRAVGRLPILLEFALPMVREGGVFVAIKGEQAAEELLTATRALGFLKGALVETRRTPTGTLVIIEKTAPTPRRYPRPVGEAAKSPL